jgi:hypothetical protein
MTKVVFFAGYKAMTVYVQEVTGVDYTADAFRMIISRDAILASERTWFNGTPRISQQALDAWIVRATGRRKRQR